MGIRTIVIVLIRVPFIKRDSVDPISMEMVDPPRDVGTSVLMLHHAMPSRRDP